MTGRLPEFLGIGAIKASTTWLYQNLFHHEQICLPATKPLRYFDRHAGRPIEAYKAIFAGAGDRRCDRACRRVARRAARGSILALG